MHQQMTFIWSARLGISAEHPDTGAAEWTQRLDRQYRAMKETLTRYPGVVGIATANSMSARAGGRGHLQDHAVLRLDTDLLEPVDMPVLGVGWDFTHTLGLGLAAGRAFSTDFATDSTGAVLLNETAVYRI